jgi:pyruvate formate lyase activating enzyme
MVGRTASVGEVMEEVLRDEVFYRTSKGGLTISGGEPTSQIEFLEALLGEAKRAGLHCALETCGHAPWERYERLRGMVDLYLYDLKETDPRRHAEYTGVENGLILSNLRKLHDAGAAVVLRLPIVPGRNDREEHLAAVARIVRELPGLRGVEIMGYHGLGESKRERFGLAATELPRIARVESAVVEGWLGRLRALGVRVVALS